MTMIKRHLRGAVFLALCLLCLSGVTRLTLRKGSIERFEPFLRESDRYDVLFLGNSLTVNAVFPMELWNSYGISAYNLSSYGNTLPVSYWTMRNFLSVSKPKLVVIDIHGVDRDYRLSGSSADVHTAMDCFPLRPLKAEAILDLMGGSDETDDDGSRYGDLLWEYLFPLGKYHTRWSDLGRSDLFPPMSTLKGGERLIGVARSEDYIVDPDPEPAEESGWGYVYLRRLIEYCLSQGIDVLPVNLPVPSKEHHQREGAAMNRLAGEYGIRAVDFIAMDSVADYATDCGDREHHANASGGLKVTGYLGSYLRAHYDLPDRSDDARWKTEYAAYKKNKQAVLAAQSSPEKALLLSRDPDTSVCLVLRDAGLLYDNETLYNLAQNIGRESILEDSDPELRSADLFPLTVLDEAAWNGEPYLAVFDRASGEIGEYTAAEESTAALSFGEIRFGGDAPLLLRTGSESLSLDDPEADMTLIYFDRETGELLGQTCFTL